MYKYFGADEPRGETPDEDCVAYGESSFRPPGTTRNDAECSLNHHYVCEFNNRRALPPTTQRALRPGMRALRRKTTAL